jgi:hypothetical protein
MTPEVLCCILPKDLGVMRCQSFDLFCVRKTCPKGAAGTDRFPK